MVVAASTGQLVTTRGRPKKDAAYNDEGTTSREAPEEATQKQRADTEGHGTVSTMINYTTATTSWRTANGRDTDMEIDSGTSRSFPQPEDT